MSKIISPSHAVDSILAKVRESDSFQPEEVKAWQENSQVYPALLKRMRGLNDEEQAACLERFDDLGAAVLAHKDADGFFLAPYIADLTLIQGLAEFLGDKNEEVREASVRQIFEFVPDLYLRNFSSEVITHLISYPETSRAAQILAKTGSEKALAIIRNNRIIREQDDGWTRQNFLN